jgi:hypothetical protein
VAGVAEGAGLHDTVSGRELQEVSGQEWGHGHYSSRDLTTATYEALLSQVLSL